MRWDNLFDDFEAQLASAGRLDQEAEVAELVRAEQAGIRLVDRLRGHGPAPIDLGLAAGVRVRGRLRQVADSWLVLDAPPHSFLVPLAAVVTVSGLGRAVRADESTVRRSMSLASGLRALARDRETVTCLVDAGRGEPLPVVGTLDTVGSDYADVVPAREGDSWRARAGGAVAVQFSRLISVRSGG